MFQNVMFTCSDRLVVSGNTCYHFIQYKIHSCIFRFIYRGVRMLRNYSSIFYVGGDLRMSRVFRCINGGVQNYNVRMQCGVSPARDIFLFKNIYLVKRSWFFLSQLVLNPLFFETHLVKNLGDCDRLCVVHIRFLSSL